MMTVLMSDPYHSPIGVYQSFPRQGRRSEWMRPAWKGLERVYCGCFTEVMHVLCTTTYIYFKVGTPNDLQCALAVGPCIYKKERRRRLWAGRRRLQQFECEEAPCNWKCGSAAVYIFWRGWVRIWKNLSISPLGHHYSCVCSTLLTMISTDDHDRHTYCIREELRVKEKRRKDVRWAKQRCRLCCHGMEKKKKI